MGDRAVSSDSGPLDITVRLRKAAQEWPTDWDLVLVLSDAADEIDALREVVETDASDLDEFRQSLQTAMWDGRNIADHMERAIELIDARGTPTTKAVKP